MKAIICPNDCSNTTTQTLMATLLQMNAWLAGTPPCDSSKLSSVRQRHFSVDEFTGKTWSLK